MRGKIDKILSDLPSPSYLTVKADTGLLHSTQNIISSSKSSSSKSKMESSGVSLTDFLDANQIKKHMLSLNKHNVQARKNTCRLCAKDALMFTSPSISCSSCENLVSLNEAFYRTKNSQITVCTSCFEREGSRISLGGTRSISKHNLQADKNEELDEEPWVMCDKCQHWVHQICALYNHELDSDKTKEYICPSCRLGENVVGQKAIPTAAKSLPTTKLSDYLEWRLFNSLRQEAESSGHDVVPGLVVRVVLVANEKLEVKQQYLNMFKRNQYPAEFPYKSKAILLFQNIDGVDVCLFAIYVQEFGSDCREPNSRCVYVSYLDSVSHFTPKRKTVAGASLRTFVYHEILIGYLAYCKDHGFTTCYIWSCLPTKGFDYIFYCHPNGQMIPNQNQLQNWYQKMIKQAMEHNIVVDCTNFYDHFFVSKVETLSRLPYFDGAYWSRVAEDLIGNLEKGIGDNGRKDAMVMRKLGKKIKESKENFFILHLHFNCTNCHNVILSGSRWSCKQCKNFHLCERCVLMGCPPPKKKYFFCAKNHLLSESLVNNIPACTEDNDLILDNDFIKDRSSFLKFCEEKHFQFNILRNAKHSTMMILYHLHKKIVSEAIKTDQQLEKKAKEDDIVHATGPSRDQECCSLLKQLLEHFISCVDSNCPLRLHMRNRT